VKSPAVWNEVFYRLRFPRRSWASAGIGEGDCAAKTTGWPVDVRDGILLQNDYEVPACGGGMLRSFAHKRDPQPSVTPHCPTSATDGKRRGISQFTGRADMRGCEGRLRSRLCAKLLSIHRRRRETPLLIAKGRSERQQASQTFPKRRGCPLFKPAQQIGTRTVTDRNLFLRDTN
jgi:hypothetical protein